MRVRCANHECDRSYIALSPIRSEWTTNGKFSIYKCPFCFFENWRYVANSYQKVRGKPAEKITIVKIME